MQVAIFQPEDPFHFLANHFEWEKSRSSALKYASTILCCQQYLHKVTEVGIQQAFLMLSQHKGNEDLMMVTGAVYMDLIQLLCFELQEHPEEELRLLESVYIPSGNVLSYRKFRAGIHCCLLYKAYLKAMKVLYGVIQNEVSPSDSITKTLTMQLLQHIHEQTKIETYQHNHQLTNEMAFLNLQDDVNVKSIIIEEFISMATSLFWKIVSVEAVLEENPSLI
ncbi:hypothetical protein CHUAL_009089 [Chamberlinius hualienensis]